MRFKEAIKRIGRKLIYFNPDIDLEKAGVDWLYKALKPEEENPKEGLLEKLGKYPTWVPFGERKIEYELYLMKKEKKGGGLNERI